MSFPSCRYGLFPTDFSLGCFSLVVLKAMASQLPVVASNVPGVDEAVVDGVEWLPLPNRRSGGDASCP
jgi:glycosyltransferase involved in cell wall biosynthesis